MKNLNDGKCEFGCGRRARFVLKMGKECCRKDARSCPEMRRKNSESKKGRCPKWADGHPRGFSGRVPWNKGKTAVELMGIIRAREYSLLLSSVNGGTGIANTEKDERQRRRKLSLIARENRCGNYGGYKKGSGRGKHGWYRGIWCDSSWELAWVMFHLDHGIPFERNRERFEYQWQGEKHRYLPDFRMADGRLVEIKAWLDDKGRAKLEACPGIQVVMKKDMEPFLRYAVEKYGKDFVRLYEKGSVAEW